MNKTRGYTRACGWAVMGSCSPSLWHRFQRYGIPSQGKDFILSAGYHPGLGAAFHTEGAPESEFFGQGRVPEMRENTGRLLDLYTG